MKVPVEILRLLPGARQVESAYENACALWMTALGVAEGAVSEEDFMMRAGRGEEVRCHNFVLISSSHLAGQFASHEHASVVQYLIMTTGFIQELALAELYERSAVFEMSLKQQRGMAWRGLQSCI